MLSVSAVPRRSVAYLNTIPTRLLRTRVLSTLVSQRSLTRSINPTSLSSRIPTPNVRDQPLRHLRNMSTNKDEAAGVDYGHFELLQSFPLKYAPVTVSKWRSKRTGLTVVVGSHKGEPLYKALYVGVALIGCLAPIVRSLDPLQQGLRADPDQD
jgi:hypothetical protein